MPKRTVNLGDGRPLLDLVSYGRRGPGRTDRLSPAQVEQIARTVRRVPEVMVKVSGGGASAKGVLAHLKYIDRHGDLEIETDDGEQLRGKGVEKCLIEGWDLEADAAEARSPYGGTPGRKPAKLVHNIILSMPAGTPAAGLLAASRTFAREQFALKHRYAMVLHTDQDHPHVHLVIKAMSERGERLNIRKATLREWRREFARHLRGQGIEANATERFVRGESRLHKIDGIYRPMIDPKRRSTHLQERAESVAADMLAGKVKIEPAKSKLVETRKEVERGWHAVSDMLVQDGRTELAAQVSRFVKQMEPPRTERERIAVGLIENAPRAHVKDRSATR